MVGEAASRPHSDAVTWGSKMIFKRKSDMAPFPGREERVYIALHTNASSGLVEKFHKYL